MAASTQVCQCSGLFHDRASGFQIRELLRVRTNVTESVRKEEKEQEGEAEGEKILDDQEGRETYSLAHSYTKRSPLKSLAEGTFPDSWFPQPCVLWTLCPFPEVLCFRTGAYESLRVATQTFLTVVSLVHSPGHVYPHCPVPICPTVNEGKVRVHCSQLNLVQSACF